ncbi:MAG: Suppressor protein stp22 of temperature-sensitive alpha-factor receptor and arginine permease [Sporothrix epigloea]
MAVQQHVLNWLYSILTSEYQDVNRTYNDVSQALSYFPSLSPRTDVHTFSNGTSALLLHLSGTIPAVFRGAAYRYPISLWVPHNYPREAPLVYVTPTETMMVRPGQHVDPQGQVYHPYLAGWAEFWDKSTIGDFLTILRDVFAKEPPVIARQASRPAPLQASTPPPFRPPTRELSSPPNQHQPQSRQQQQPPPPPPKGNEQTQYNPASHAPSPPPPPPPPVPPHPSSLRNSTYATSPELSTSPPVPPYSSSAANGNLRSSWHGSIPPSSHAGGPPLVPVRPQFQSPLRQLSPSTSQQNERPPYDTHSHTTSPPPLQSYPAGYGQQLQALYYQQHQSQYQQQLPFLHQYNPHQQQPTQQQVQARSRQPPPPDIMDEPVQSSSTAPRLAPGATDDNRQASGQPSSDFTSPPPPVPLNPEKDALLHQLAQSLATLRQQSCSKNEASMAGLQAQRTAMLTAFGRLQQDLADVERLSAMLASNTDILHESLAAADNVVASSKQMPIPAVDDLLVGPTVVANQLYDLVAEERALADAVFMLGRAVERGRVNPAVFAKLTRSLAREWYLKKALVRKVGRGMGLASA